MTNFKTVTMADQDRMSIKTVVKDIPYSKFLIKYKHCCWLYPEVMRLKTKRGKQ